MHFEYEYEYHFIEYEYDGKPNCATSKFAIAAYRDTSAKNLKNAEDSLLGWDGSVARSATGRWKLPSVFIAEEHLAIVAIAKISVELCIDVAGKELNRTIRKSERRSTRMVAAKPSDT